MKSNNLLRVEPQAQKRCKQTQLKTPAQEILLQRKKDTKQQLSREEWLNLNSAIASIIIHHPLSLRETDTNTINMSMFTEHFIKNCMVLWCKMKTESVLLGQSSKRSLRNPI